MSKRTDTLLNRVARLQLDTAVSRRREDLVQQAVAAGHSLEYADLIYDVAEEEDIDPAVAFEVVLAGVGVRELGEPPGDNWEETQVEAVPEWIEPPRAEEISHAERERHMRMTFRRLRRLLQEEPSIADGLRAFVAAPDVGDVEY
ncbi:MAG: hypothetical protein ACT443_16380 [Gemmatimonadota bacterium]